MPAQQLKPYFRLGACLRRRDKKVVLHRALFVSDGLKFRQKQRLF